MTATQTPGLRFVLRQQYPSGRWQVVTVDLEQARTIAARGIKVFKSSRQAYTVRDKLERKREEQS